MVFCSDPEIHVIYIPKIVIIVNATVSFGLHHQECLRKPSFEEDEVRGPQRPSISRW